MLTSSHGYRRWSFISSSLRLPEPWGKSCTSASVLPQALITLRGAGANRQARCLPYQRLVHDTDVIANEHGMSGGTVQTPMFMERFVSAVQAPCSRQ